ncbi:MAG: DUF489 family protein, partial [Mariprofundales bacterium]
AIFNRGDHALALYDNRSSHLDSGLRLVERLFGGRIDAEAAKPLLTYSANLIGIEKQLRHHPDTLAALASGIDRIQKQVDYFGDPAHENIIASIADLYGDTVSLLKPRVVVRGKSEHLRQSHNTNRVRALLLSGLRGAHCWHHAGGNHLRLLLGRSGLLHGAQQLRGHQDSAG